MPNLAIIPAVALSDERVTDTHLRVLCAVGTHTNKLGGNVWASVDTLAKASRLSSRTVQRSLQALEEAGYLRRTDRPGRTSLFEICLDATMSGVTELCQGGVTQLCQGGVTELCHPNDKMNEKPNERAQDKVVKAQAQQVCAAIWEVYPKRDTPHLYPPALRAIRACLEDGAEPERLRDAAYLYASDVLRKGTEPKYVKTIHKFYADGAWEHYVTEVRVYGRTREEWARSGQDVAEFDRIVEGTHAA